MRDELQALTGYRVLLISVYESQSFLDECAAKTKYQGTLDDLSIASFVVHINPSDVDSRFLTIQCFRQGCRVGPRKYIPGNKNKLNILVPFVTNVI